MRISQIDAEMLTLSSQGASLSKQIKDRERKISAYQIEVQQFIQARNEKAQAVAELKIKKKHLLAEFISAAS
jgi:chorismate mutase